MLQFRQATLNDVTALKDLASTTWQQFEGTLGDETWTFLSRALEKVNYTTLVTDTFGAVCEANGRIVGMAFLVPSGNPTEIFPSDWSYVRMVTVHQEYNGKGIGRGLMIRCVDEARKRHETVIALHTSEFMNAARHIYESMGFKVVRELEPRFGKKYWLYRMDL